ncbi:hypothetical protein EYF80_006599 [Liparis tanakae]|uniref:Uncharacterized protein n=1 Tax=Liparis tanakae TaxID=230148 RepID=A0A4Z2J0B9_9TELE|nr:hypothetical protein EYF80_006599 [Liparis tanakae]
MEGSNGIGSGRLEPFGVQGLTRRLDGTNLLKTFGSCTNHGCHRMSSVTTARTTKRTTKAACEIIAGGATPPSGPSGESRPEALTLPPPPASL